MFADHGIVHARDVALGVVRLVDVVDGVLLPGRPPARRAFVTALGVATAYLHDVGMVDMTRGGRRVHAIRAAQDAFGPDVDDARSVTCWRAGPVRSGWTRSRPPTPFAVSLELVVRELLSLSVIHGKSPCPGTGPRRPRRAPAAAPAVQGRRSRRPAGRRAAPPATRADPSADHRLSGAADAYAWLAAPRGAQAELADDAIDAMRVLRAADVLRQRGTVLRTSGGFEVCMDAETARAVCTLRPATGDAAYVITYDDPRGAGEANIREAVVTAAWPPADRVPPWRVREPGRRASAPRRASRASIVDIQADVIPSFSGTSVGGGLTAPTRTPDDDPDPARATRRPARVRGRGRRAGRGAATRRSRPRLVTVADTESADRAERGRFLAAEPLDGGEPGGGRPPAAARRARAPRSTASTVRRRSRRWGGSTVARRRGAGRAGLARRRSCTSRWPTGLVVRPIGGYAPSPLPAWVPVGTTGVIRRAERNSDIVAVADVEVVVIPGEVYARAWLRPLTAGELVARLRPTVSA